MSSWRCRRRRMKWNFVLLCPMALWQKLCFFSTLFYFHSALFVDDENIIGFHFLCLPLFSFVSTLFLMVKFTCAFRAHEQVHQMSKKLNFRRLISVTHSMGDFLRVFFVFRCFSFQCSASLSFSLPLFRTMCSLRWVHLATNHCIASSNQHCCRMSASDACSIDTHTRDERWSMCGWTWTNYEKNKVFLGLIAKLTKLVQLIRCRDRRQRQQHTSS